MQKKQKKVFIDFCAGIGGGRLGLEKAGFVCSAHSEINKSASDLYNIFFEDTGHECDENLGDLTLITPDCLPKAELFIAGFPCQTFSILGKRKGFQDVRGQIIYHLSKILQNTQTPYFIFENVKGLTNHNGGKTLLQIIELLKSKGYAVFYKVLNSADFGVPQVRERVYFVGIRQDLCKKKFEFPSGGVRVPFSSVIDIFENNDIQNVNHPTFVKYLNNKYNRGRIDIDAILKEELLIVDTRQSDLRLFKDECPTLRLGRHGLLYVQNGKLHKLSGQESLLLQGFPIEYVKKTLAIPKGRLLSLAGNAMTVNVIKAIGDALSRYMEE